MSRSSSCRSRRLALAGALLSTAVLPMAVAAPATAATREVHVQYLNQDGWGNTKYDIRFNGTVTSNGPTGYIIDGDLNGYCSSTLTGQSMTFGFGPSKQSWSWKSYWCTDEPHIHIKGTRAAGDTIDMQVGATAGIANTYKYGDKQTFDIGND